MTAQITVREWEKVGADDPRLAGRALDDDPGVWEAVERLRAAGVLRVLELRRGLEVQATSWVGRVQLGSLEVTVVPKLEGVPLLRLLRYAYRLRDLTLIERARWGTAPESFQDLIVRQLVAEVGELLGRGLHQTYRRVSESMGSPRGRVDLRGVARGEGAGRAELPCWHFPRDEDNDFNQALRGGLELGLRSASDVAVRGEARRLLRRLGGRVGSRPLTRAWLSGLERRHSRATAAYRPVLGLIGLLAEALGVGFEGGEEVELPGVVFDMNRFFQALLGRFLRDHVRGRSVEEEVRLVGAFRYAPGRNPRRRRPPAPRPDFVVTERGEVAEVLDAKYRDLWASPPPTDMLYQVGIYAASRGVGGRATIVYPAEDPRAREAEVEVVDPAGRAVGRIVLRPVDLRRIAGWVGSRTVSAQRAAEGYAAYLVGGDGEVRTPISHGLRGN